jgi:hypothetical protein
MSQAIVEVAKPLGIAVHDATYNVYDYNNKSYNA